MNRLEMNNGWMICNECGAKLYDINYPKDLDKSCPYIKGDKGECTDKLNFS